MPHVDEPRDLVDDRPSATARGAAVLGVLVADGRLPTVLAGARSWDAHVDRLRLTRHGSVEIIWVGGPTVGDVAHLLEGVVPRLSRRVIGEDRVLLSYGGRVPVELVRVRNC